MENHVTGHFCRFGVWVDKKFSWIDASWNKRLNYKVDSLVTDVLLKNPNLSLEIQVEDGVNHFHDLLVRKVKVKNTAEKEREVRVFFSHDLHLSDTDKGITAYYDPKIDGIAHFKKDRYFLASGRSGSKGLFQFTVGVTEFGGLSGTWKDAEDGVLSNNTVVHGSVDSTVSLKTVIPGRGEKTVYYWIAAGTKLEEIYDLHRIVHACISSNKNHFKNGLNDMFEIKRKYGNILDQLVTKKVYPTEFEEALKPKREDIKTVICFNK